MLEKLTVIGSFCLIFILFVVFVPIVILGAEVTTLPPYAMKVHDGSPAAEGAIVTKLWKVDSDVTSSYYDVNLEHPTGLIYTKGSEVEILDRFEPIRNKDGKWVLRGMAERAETLIYVYYLSADLGPLPEDSASPAKK